MKRQFVEYFTIHLEVSSLGVGICAARKVDVKVFAVFRFVLHKQAFEKSSVTSKNFRTFNKTSVFSINKFLLSPFSLNFN